MPNTFSATSVDGAPRLSSTKPLEDKGTSPLREVPERSILKHRFTLSELKQALDAASKILSMDGEKDHAVSADKINNISVSRCFDFNVHPAIENHQPEIQGVDAQPTSDTADFHLDEIAYAFATFDDLLVSMRRREYANLPDFEESCKAAKSFKKNLIELENGLEGIKEIFKDASLFEEISEDTSQEKFQYFLDRLTKIKMALKPLKPTLENLKAINNSLKNKLPSQTQLYILRVVSVTLTMAGTILAIFSISATPLSVLMLLGSFALETRNYLLEQKIKSWKSFESSLENFKKHSPIKEKKVFQALSVLAKNVNTANENAAQMMKVIEEMRAEIKALKEERNQSTDVQSKTENNVVTSVNSSNGPETNPNLSMVG